jgi:hypothetical protein
MVLHKHVLQQAQSAVGVMAEWVLVYHYRMKCAPAVVTCCDRTPQTISTGDSVDEGKRNAFNATGSSIA